MQFSFRTLAQGGGVAIEKTVTRDVEAVNSREITLPHGAAGTLSTRDDASEGTLTLSGGHGIQTGDKIDIYWVGGHRRHVTVGTVATNDVPFSGGLGDNLPAEDFAVVATKQVTINLPITTALLSFIAFEAAYPTGEEAAQTAVQLCRADTSEIQLVLLTANHPQTFDLSGTADNGIPSSPLADDDDDVTTLAASCGSATSAATLRVIVATDPTP